MNVLLFPTTSFSCFVSIRLMPQIVATADFSSVKVRLLTSTGQAKEVVECTPDGGYLVPVYDTKGSYRLQVQGPSGWSFGMNGEMNSGM
jgi:hypothetical protein